MNRDSKDCKHGYKDTLLDWVFAIFGQFLFVPIVGCLAGMLWLFEQVPEFANRSIQDQTNIVLLAFFIILLIAGFIIWKFQQLKPARPIDREREAEIFYGFRKSDEKE